MEDILSNEERNAILKQVFTPPAPKEQTSPPKRSSVITEGTADLSRLSFGELLEKTLEARDKINAEDSSEEKRIDEARDAAITHSRFDILKDWHL